MNNRQLEKNISKNAARVKKDLNTLMGNSAAQVSEGFEKFTDDTKETLSDAVETVKKDVGQGLNQYNDKVQEFADKVPGDLGKKAANYPWVAISIGLGIGFLLGGLLKPNRQS